MLTGIIVLAAPHICRLSALYAIRKQQRLAQSGQNLRLFISIDSVNGQRNLRSGYGEQGRGWDLNLALNSDAIQCYKYNSGPRSVISH